MITQNDNRHAAAAYGHIELMRYLLDDAGGDVNIVDNDGDTPLHHNESPGKFHRTGVCFFTTSSSCYIPYCYINLYFYELFLLYSGYSAMAEYLISRGADVNAMNSSGITPPFTALLDENEELVDFYKSIGIDIAISLEEMQEDGMVEATIGEDGEEGGDAE